MGKKGRKTLNPADEYRRQQKKQQLKKNKQQRQMQREQTMKKKGSLGIREELRRLQQIESQNQPLGKKQKDKKLQLKKALQEQLKREADAEAKKAMKPQSTVVVKGLDRILGASGAETGTKSAPDKKRNADAPLAKEEPSPSSEAAPAAPSAAAAPALPPGLAPPPGMKKKAKRIAPPPPMTRPMTRPPGAGVLPPPPPARGPHRGHLPMMPPRMAPPVPMRAGTGHPPAPHGHHLMPHPVAHGNPQMAPPPPHRGAPVHRRPPPRRQREEVDPMDPNGAGYAWQPPRRHQPSRPMYPEMDNKLVRAGMQSGQVNAEDAYTPVARRAPAEIPIPAPKPKEPIRIDPAALAMTPAAVAVRHRHSQQSKQEILRRKAAAAKAKVRLAKQAAASTVPSMSAPNAAPSTGSMAEFEKFMRDVGGA